VSILRKILAALLALLLLFSLIQGFLFRFSLVLPFVAVSLAGLLLCLRWDVFVRAWKNLRKRLWGKIITHTAIVLLFCALTLFTVISAFMINAVTVSPPEGDATVIVLGAQVVGYRPSLILQLRLESALEYLHENPQAVAVLSGGLGESAHISEAAAMQIWLVERGICRGRLLLEERSTNTYENIAFSRAIIEANDLPRNVVIATDGFHMYRAHNLASGAGLSPSSIPSRTPLRLLPFYWVREVAAILAM